MDARYGWVGLVFVLAFGSVIYFFTSFSLREVVEVSPSTQVGNTGARSESTMQLTSTAFQHNASIPLVYTCDGANTNPALSFEHVPAKAVSLALIMDDPDVPKQVKPDGVFDHWVLFNIPPNATGVAEHSSLGTPGANGSGTNAYIGPCPPPQYEPTTHRYIFTLYALDTALSLDAGAKKQDVLDAVQGHVLAQAELIGTYGRK